MPLAEIPRGEDAIAEINKIEPLNNDQKTQITELFEDILPQIAQVFGIFPAKCNQTPLITSKITII